MDTLAVTYLKRNEPERAIRYLQDAIAIKKEPRYLFHLLMAYEKLGKEQEYRDTRSLLSQIDLDVSGLTAVERELYEKTVLESSSGVPQTVTASEAQGHGKSEEASLTRKSEGKHQIETTASPVQELLC